MNMKKLYLMIGVIIAVLFMIVLLLFIYRSNQQVKQEQLEHQKEIEAIKSKQKSIDEAFIREQQEKEAAINQEQTELKFKDEDKDGLTYEEEVKLGTSDTERDSDGDSVDDDKDLHAAGGAETKKITVQWRHGGQVYTTQFGIPEDKYWYYKNYQRNDYNYEDGRFATPDDPVIQTIAKDITDVSLSTGDTCTICIAIDFVQSMIYQFDIDYISKPDYPKFALETIIDEKGDCEDTSFLMASILEALNYDVILLLYSDHMAVGVWCETCSGTYYTYKGRNYFFLETTGYADNWEMGAIWGKYGAESATFIDVGN